MNNAAQASSLILGAPAVAGQGHLTYGSFRSTILQEQKHNEENKENIPVAKYGTNKTVCLIGIMELRES